MNRAPEKYIFTNGWTMMQENDFPHAWILRDNDDKNVDRDHYRNDIIDRHDLKVAEHINDPF